MTWNILHGGGAHRLPEIILSLLAHQPDVLVLTEFRVTRGSQIRAALADHGLEHQLAARAPDRVNGTLLASRTPLRAITLDDAPGRGRWVAAELLEHALLVAGVHVPDDTCGPEKKSFWNFLLRTADVWKEQSAVILGDFNTSHAHQDGGPKNQRCEKQLRALLALGYVDAWRSKHPDQTEYSWFSHDGQGWRIDAAYLSPALRPCLQTAWYSQLEREAKHSDHAPLLLELHLPHQQPAEPAPPSIHPRKQGLFAHAPLPAE